MLHYQASARTNVLGEITGTLACDEFVKLWLKHCELDNLVKMAASLEKELTVSSHAYITFMFLNSCLNICMKRIPTWYSVPDVFFIVNMLILQRLLVQHHSSRACAINAHIVQPFLRPWKFSCAILWPQKYDSNDDEFVTKDEIKKATLRETQANGNQVIVVDSNKFVFVLFHICAGNNYATSAVK